MRTQKWQRAIAFAASAAMVLNTNGVQSLVQGIGDVVKAAELNSEVILDEEITGPDTSAGMNGADDVIVQEVDVWSSYEESGLVVEEVEVLSVDDAEQMTGNIHIEDFNAQADMVPEGEGIPMEVAVSLTETAAPSLCGPELMRLRK